MAFLHFSNKHVEMEVEIKTPVHISNNNRKQSRINLTCLLWQHIDILKLEKYITPAQG